MRFLLTISILLAFASPPAWPCLKAAKGSARQRQTVGLEVELAGLTPAQTTALLAKGFSVSARTTRSITFLSGEPKRSSRRISVVSRAGRVSIYEIREGNYVDYFVLKEGKPAQPSVPARSLEEARREALAILKLSGNWQDHERRLAPITNYTRFFAIQNADGELGTTKVSFDYTAFASFGVDAEIFEDRMSFQSVSEAEAYVQTLLARKYFVFSQEMETPHGTIRVKNEVLAHSDNLLRLVSPEFYGTEVILPPLPRIGLPKLLPIYRWLKAEGAKFKSTGFAIGLHVNLGIDPNRLDQVQQFILNVYAKEDELIHRFANQPERAPYIKRLPKNAISYLASIPKAKVNRRVLLKYQSMLEDRMYIVNILPLLEQNDRYRPAIEVRLPDGVESAEQVEEVVDTFMDLFPHDET